jgi:two-component system, cell cycle sensor histidine kinase and response regulator CckA
MSGECVLVVEDNPITRKLLRVALESENFVVVEAAEAETARDLMLRAEPDAVVLDVRLPVPAGTDLGAALRELAGSRKVPLLAFLGFVSNTHDSAISRVFDDVLPTPLEPSVIPDIVRTHLQRTPVTTAAARRQVLIVDDNPIQAKLLSIQLAGAGFQVRTANDGSEALALARQCHPDAIMSDVMMPNVDGFTLCLALRDDPDLRTLPVVLFSSGDGEESHKLAREVGANAFVARNGDGAAMVGALLHALAGASEFESVSKRSSLPPKLARWMVEHAASAKSSHSRLAERCTNQAVQLAVLGSIAESLASPVGDEETLNSVFRQCLDACGITRGALFLAAPVGRLRCDVHFGYSDRELSDLEKWFPGSAAARAALDGEIRILSIPDAITNNVVGNSGLALPLVSGGRALGVLVVQSRDKKLTEPAGFSLIRIVSLELAQALGLGAACETLAASEQGYRALMENANDAIFIQTTTGSILEANRHAEELLGRPRHTIVNRRFRDFTAPPADVTTVDGSFPPDGADAQRFRGSIVHPDGAIIPFEGSSAVFDTIDGKLVVRVVRDVSAQRRAEAELRQSEQKYRNLLEASPDIYWSTDGTGQSRYLSPNMARITGFTPAELERGGRELWSSRVDPRDLQPLEIAYVEAVRGGAAFDLEYRFRRKDGRWIWFHGRSYFSRDADGKFCIHFMNSEITARKELEQREAVRYAVTRAIAESRSLAQALHEFLPSWCESLGWDEGRVWLLDTDAKTLRLEVSLGADPPHSEQLRQSTGCAQSSLSQRVLARGRIEWSEDDGTAGPRSALAFPLLWEGNVLGVVECICAERRAPDLQLEELARDVGNQLGALIERKRAESKLRRVEDELRQAQKMEAIGQLAGGIAHDFNNLLSIVLMTSSVLLDDLGSGDPRREDVEEIRGASERAAELTRRLLTFSRRTVVEPTPVNLGAIVAGMEKMLRRVLGADVELVTSTAADLGQVRADTGQIEQILLNLSVNARDAMPGGGTLLVESTNVDLDSTFVEAHPGVEPGHFVALIVSDSGCGMNDEVKRRIFEPFFTTKEAGRGTGLGLATVYGIVKQAGGSIWVYSEPGRGTTFKVYLPRIGVADEAQSGSAEATEAFRGTETVLLVDDEQRLRCLMSRVLRSLGYTVLEANGGEEALTIARDFGGSIDAMITDVVMPKVCGPEVAQRFAALRPEAKLLYVSGFTDHASVRKNLLDPGANMLQKPFSAAALGARVRELFHGRAARES